MHDKRIFLSESHPSGRELEYVQKAFQANAITSGGNVVQDFENDLALFLNQNSFVAATNSGTAAIHLALLLLGVQPGDEVLCQTLTFSASVNPILYIGATPIFIDSEEETWNMCPLALEDAIQESLRKGKKPKCIVVVDLYGMPFQVEKIQAVANKYSIPILEDSAEALGSRYKDKPCGTLGDIGVFSFNGNKIITTSSGGALLLSDLMQKERATFLATQARDVAPYYQHSEVGYNYAMSSIAAAIGRGQLEALEERIQARRFNHTFYNDLFASYEGITVFSEPDSDFFSNYWLTTILIDKEKMDGLTPEVFRLYLEEFNIEARPLWKPMHLQPVFEKYSFYGGTIAASLFESGLCLPSSSNLNAQSRERIEEVIISLLQKYKSS
ncbi:aminotransferase class I/II-fold pyridoxal phosphate-dependent enzyme [Flavobacterium sp.]|uniref:aminotransferase class I/II-fold pyridoxal phosphate-dependent enzyme n=1 Tax=Flavobacterium sp. TaxID=239 RepID=UPI002625D343|nr:aminotransferase class I/II-fold pyridoxal phosphate-dependent enzyme [Flavobacterium sp.]